MNCATMSAIHSYIERSKIRTYSTSCLVFSGKYALTLFDFHISVKILDMCVFYELYIRPQFPACEREFFFRLCHISWSCPASCQMGQVKLLATLIQYRGYEPEDSHVLIPKRLPVW